MDYPILIKNGKGFKIISQGKVYPIADVFSIKMLPKLKTKSLVIGFIGPRGAGKSINMSRLAITDDILKGRRVWSNMDIGIRVQKGNDLVTYCTEPLDKLQLKDMDELYSDGCLVIDEVNMEVAEARRAQSNTNLIMNNIVQQLRKRRLDFLWSAQSEMHVDARLRWQTDIFVKCTDVSLPNGDGELSKVELYDYSGIFKGKSPDSQKQALMFTTVLRNKPWWYTTDTWKLQGMDDEIAAVQPETEIPAELKEKAEKIKGIILATDDQRISRSEVYQMFRVFAKREKEYITQILSTVDVIPENHYYKISKYAGVLV